MELKNKGIREAAKKNGVPLWRLADMRGISEPTLTRLLRRPLPAHIEQEMLVQINQLAKEDKADG